MKILFRAAGKAIMLYVWYLTMDCSVMNSTEYFRQILEKTGQKQILPLVCLNDILNVAKLANKKALQRSEICLHFFLVSYFNL